MFQLSIILFTKAIKLFGVTSAVYDIYTSLFGSMEINLSLLVYTLAIEALFIFLKYTPIKVPVWVKALEDFV
jgi:hypothetical protein